MSQAPLQVASHDWPARMRRTVASQYLFDKHGVTLSAATLAKLAVVGGGPKFWKDGAFPIYGAAHLDEFAVARLGKLRRSTSDAGEVCGVEARSARQGSASDNATSGLAPRHEVLTNEP